jgi:hypothetical protein
MRPSRENTESTNLVRGGVIDPALPWFQLKNMLGAPVPTGDEFLTKPPPRDQKPEAIFYPTEPTFFLILILNLNLNLM